MPVGVPSDLMDTNKVSKQSVDYSLGGDHCGACQFFYGEVEASETGLCMKVRGEIKEDYWCKLFRRA